MFFGLAGLGFYFIVPRGTVGYVFKLGAHTWGRPYGGGGLTILHETLKQ